MTAVRVILVSVLVTVPLNAPAYAEVNRGLAYTFEALGGFGGGAAAGVAGIPVGNLLFTTEDYAGGGLVGFSLFYPVGCGLGVYIVGEAASGDSPNDLAAAGASVGAAVGTVFAGYLTAGWKGVLIGIIAAPVGSTVAYNLARTGRDETGDGFYVSYAITF